MLSGALGILIYWQAIADLVCSTQTLNSAVSLCTVKPPYIAPQFTANPDLTLKFPFPQTLFHILIICLVYWYFIACKVSNPPMLCMLVSLEYFLMILTWFELHWLCLWTRLYQNVLNYCIGLHVPPAFCYLEVMFLKYSGLNPPFFVIFDLPWDPRPIMTTYSMFCTEMRPEQN